MLIQVHCGCFGVCSFVRDSNDFNPFATSFHSLCSLCSYFYHIAIIGFNPSSFETRFVRLSIIFRGSFLHFLTYFLLKSRNLNQRLSARQVNRYHTNNVSRRILVKLASSPKSPKHFCAYYVPKHPWMNFIHE